MYTAVGTIWRAFRRGLIDRVRFPIDCALEAESVTAAYSWASLHHL